MPFATPTELDTHIADILNAAQTWGGAIAAGIRSSGAIINARKESSLEVLEAISKNPQHGYFGELSSLVDVLHNSFLPAHDGEIGIPQIVPFEGATARDAIKADPDEIDSFRNNPASYTGAHTGIPVPHDQPDATKVEGAILTASLNAGGGFYAANDTGTVATGDGLATYQVLTVSAGAVVTFLILNRGSGYNVANGLATAPGGAQPGAGSGFTLNVLTIGSTGTGKQSPISCRFSIVSSYFKFTGLRAQIPMMIIDTTMRDTKLPLRLGPAVVKLAIPKLVKPGDALAMLAREYGADGKQDLVEIAGGAMTVRPVKAVPDIVAALKQN